MQSDIAVVIAATKKSKRVPFATIAIVQFNKYENLTFFVRRNYFEKQQQTEWRKAQEARFRLIAPILGVYKLYLSLFLLIALIFFS